MKRLGLFFFLWLVNAYSQSVVAHTGQAAQASDHATTAGIATTSATLLVCGVSVYAADATTGTLTDSNGNTWNHANNCQNLVTADNDSTIFYSYNKAGGALVVGPGHTFTFTKASSYPAIACVAFSGTLTSSTPLDQQACNTGNGDTVQASITPATNGQIVFTVAAENGSIYTSGGNPTINQAYTVLDKVDFSSGINDPIASAWLLEGAAALSNPTWSFGAGDMGHYETSSASFKPAVTQTATPVPPGVY